MYHEDGKMSHNFLRKIYFRLKKGLHLRLVHTESRRVKSKAYDRKHEKMLTAKFFMLSRKILKLKLGMQTHQNFEVSLSPG